MRRRRWYFNKWVVLLYIVAAQMGWGIYKFHRDFSLWCAAFRGDLAATDHYLNRGANPDARWQGLHALGGAIWKGHRQTAFLLVRRGADPNLAVSQVIRHGDPVLLNAMLSRGLNVRGEEGSKALPLAVIHGKPEMVKILLQCGADPFAREQDSGDTVLKIAQEQAAQKASGSSRVLSLLRSATTEKEQGTISKGGR